MVGQDLQGEWQEGRLLAVLRTYPAGLQALQHAHLCYVLRCTRVLLSRSAATKLKACSSASHSMHRPFLLQGSRRTAATAAAGCGGGMMKASVRRTKANRRRGLRRCQAVVVMPDDYTRFQKHVCRACAISEYHQKQLALAGSVRLVGGCCEGVVWCCCSWPGVCVIRRITGELDGLGLSLLCVAKVADVCLALMKL